MHYDAQQRNESHKDKAGGILTPTRSTIERQRWYDVIRRLKQGEVIENFTYTQAGKTYVAEKIYPINLAPFETQYVEHYICVFGHRGERGPRICELSSKDTGNLKFYGNYAECGFGKTAKGNHHRRCITCPLAQIYGVVKGIHVRQ